MYTKPSELRGEDRLSNTPGKNKAKGLPEGPMFIVIFHFQGNISMFVRSSDSALR